MAPNFDPNKELFQPSKLDAAVAEQAKDYDCLPCRLMGTTAFVGLGIYTYASGMSQLKQRKNIILQSGSRIGMGPRKFGVVALSVTLVGMGCYRMVPAMTVADGTAPYVEVNPGQD